MYYMLNLMFNYSDSSTSINGRFVDYDPSQTEPLLTSKAWLQSVATAPDPNCSTDWTFFERDKQHLDFTSQPPSPTLMVRVVDSNTADTFSARITIVMGRNDQKHPPQPMSSPIVNLNGVSGPVCIWDAPFASASTTPRGGTIASWVTTLGSPSLYTVVPVKAGSPPSPSVNNYLFLVTATVQGTVGNNPVTRTLCHDPDMDISC